MDLGHSRHSLLFHPVTILFLQIATIALVVGFTSPFSVFRPAALLLFLGSIWLVIPTCLEYIPRTPWAAMIAAVNIAYLLHFIEVALLNKWSFNANGLTLSNHTETEKASKGTAWERLRFGLLVAFSSRYIGTPSEVKYVPHFSTRDPSYVPSRTKFLLRELRTTILCYLAFDVLTNPSLRPENYALLSSPGAVPLLRRLNELSIEEVLFRTGCTFAFWISSCFGIKIVQSVLAFAAVAPGLSEVKSWRPAFGPLVEAYTVRHFWR